VDSPFNETSALINNSSSCDNGLAFRRQFRRFLSSSRFPCDRRRGIVERSRSGREYSSASILRSNVCARGERKPSVPANVRRVRPAPPEVRAGGGPRSRVRGSQSGMRAGSIISSRRIPSDGVFNESRISAGAGILFLSLPLSGVF